MHFFKTVAYSTSGNSKMMKIQRAVIQNCTSLYEMSVVLLWAAEQFIQVAVTDHLAALAFPKVVLQTVIDLSKVLHAFGDVVTVVVFEGPLVTRGPPGRHRGGTQEGAQQKQRRDHLHFCEASCSRVLKRNEVRDTGIAVEQISFSNLLPGLHFSFLSCELWEV